DQVAGQHEEIEIGVLACRGFQEMPPALQPRLGIAQVEEPDGTRPTWGGLHRLPGPPSTRSPISERVVVDRPRLQAGHLDSVSTDQRIVEEVRTLETRRAPGDDPDLVRARLPSRRPYSPCAGRCPHKPKSRRRDVR